LGANALGCAIEQGPLLPAPGQREKRARSRREMRETRQKIARSSGCATALAMPLVADNRDDIDHRSGFHRIMDEMRITPEPRARDGLAEIGAHPLSRHDGTPRGAVCGARGLTVAEPRAQR